MNANPEAPERTAKEFRQRWTLGRKIGGLAAALLLLTLAVAVFSLVKLREMGGEIDEIASLQLPMNRLLAETEIAQLEEHIAFERALRLATEEAGEPGRGGGRGLAYFEGNAGQVDEKLPKLLELARRARSEVPEHAEEYDQLIEQQGLLHEHHEHVEAQQREMIARLSEGGGVTSADLDELEQEAADVDEKVEDMLLVVGRLTDESARTTQAHEQSALRVGAGLSALALGLGVVLAVLIVRALVRSVREFSEKALRIAGGDLTVDEIRVASSDEIGEMALAFNQMLAGLRRQIGETRSAVETLSSTSSEILASTQEQASTTKEQAATVQEVTSTMQELGQSGSQISERAKQIATGAEASSSASTAGLTAVEETNAAMESIREQVEEVAENIVLLSEKTQAVGEIISAVNDIAEQSNLLALNASIEAAAAAEHGSRFSVVASEIKHLADHAKESTGQVRTILSDIQKGINSAVMLTEEAVKRVDAGKQRAQVTEETIRNLAQTIEESVQAFQQIIAGTGQQQIGFEQVTQGMKDIQQAAEQASAGTSQLESAVANLNSMGQEMRATLERYRL